MSGFSDSAGSNEKKHSFGRSVNEIEYFVIFHALKEVGILIYCHSSEINDNLKCDLM